ncbi:spore coat protein [Paenibacillus marinisediminis]
MSMIGRVVRIDRGGPESRSGKLIAVKQDYLAIDNKREGIIYYNSEHIKSMTVNGYYCEDHGKEDCYPSFDEPCFIDVLSKMKYRTVQINRSGPEKVVGVLTSVGDDRLLVIVKGEVVTVFTYHVRSISVVCKENDDCKDEDDYEDDCDDDDDDDDDKDCEDDHHKKKCKKRKKCKYEDDDKYDKKCRKHDK